MINLRYHLLPYIYSVSWQVTSDGYTMMRPLVMDFRRRHQCSQHRRSISVRPGIDGQSGHQGRRDDTATSICRRAADWFDFWTGKTYAGGQTVEAAAPIETLPLFVRAGSIIPLRPGDSIRDGKGRPD